MIIAVGTNSDLKVRAVIQALMVMQERGVKQLGDLDFSCRDLRAGETDSGIPAQPFGLGQMFRGAENRARAALKTHSADIGIGIENGLVQVGKRWFDPPAVAIVYPRDQVIGFALGAALPIPTGMVNDVLKQNSELGVIVQTRAGGGEKDPHKYLSKGVLDRESIIAQAVLSALTVLISPDEYRVFNPNE